MKKILIVEDDQIVANIYRNKFSVEGYQVEIALDGLVGLEMVHSFRPDAIILDLMLPKMTGVELMKKVRAEADFQNLPVIVFFEHIPDEHGSGGVEGGCHQMSFQGQLYPKTSD